MGIRDRVGVLGNRRVPGRSRAVAEFAFDTVGVHRLEARAAVKNGRGNGALRKIGAVQEGLLRKSFLKDGEYLDQALWAILAGRLESQDVDGNEADIHLTETISH